MSCDSDQSDFLNPFRSQKNATSKNLVPSPTARDLAPSPYADCYNMNHKRRGTAIIFNHVDFSLKECPKREGSDKDRADLEDIFHELDFDVLVHNNLTHREILSTLITVSQMDHSESDCLVIVAMTHGDSGVLYARDRDYPTKTLWKYFNARNCPTLAGKPKLFFIQACRGSGVHPAQTLHYKVDTDSNSTEEATYSIPVMADILVMYSTVEGFYSWRSPKEGGYFIQSLVKQLRTHYKTQDLLTILTFVNREVAVDFTSYEPDIPKFNGVKQMCSFVSMLTRLVYFPSKSLY